MTDKPLIIGVTGSVGMGKSTLAGQLASLGAQVCSADAIVHRLLAGDGQAVEEITRHFPEAVQDGAVDRRKLGDIVFGDREKRRRLEQLLHPLVVAEENRFIEEQARLGADVVVLEIPLLFETGAQSRCDAVIVATAPACVQRWRVMRRPGMTRERFLRILEAQMPDREKRARADYVVQTGWGKAYSLCQAKRIMKDIRRKQANAA